MVSSTNSTSDKDSDDGSLLRLVSGLALTHVHIQAHDQDNHPHNRTDGLARPELGGVLPQSDHISEDKNKGDNQANQDHEQTKRFS